MPEGSKGRSGNGQEDDGRLEIDLLKIGKRVGLSFAEMNELRVQDLFAFARSYLGIGDDEREATQDDIDAFYRG